MFNLLDDPNVREIVLDTPVGTTHTGEGQYRRVDTVEAAMRMLVAKEISEVYIGGMIGDRFSPNGVIRRWNDNGMVMKMINFRGQEGSGGYFPLDMPWNVDGGCRRFYEEIVENATVRKGGMIDRYRISKGQAPMECDTLPTVMVR